MNTFDGKSFGCVFLDHNRSNVNSYLASVHAQHSGNVDVYASFISDCESLQISLLKPPSSL